jgi:ActR/RegA family two-component response regulator
MEKPRLLFVDDDESIRQTLPAILTDEGFAVTAVATVAEAIGEMTRRPFEILLSDLNIGQPGDGFTVVSAMRRIQPQARTFILTGYPDFTSALEAIRNQVDDYLVKPAHIPTLLKTLRLSSERPQLRNAQGKRASTVIRENTDAIIGRWFRECDCEPRLKSIVLADPARIDHLPALLRQLADRIDKNPVNDDKRELESASAHGRMRRQQGYSLTLIFTETRILYDVIAETIQGNLVEMDISFIIPDLILISDHLNALLEESLRSFLSAEPIAA